jgi:stage V sporulation protein R
MMQASRDDAYVRELETAIERIWEIALRMGLDPFPVNFELVPATIMYEFGSYGLPGRFSHWSRGKAYYRMKTEYDYGLSKIYELVVNTNPSYAFLMEQNDLLQNKVVVAHVLGHTDMFKHNVYFRHTSRNMIDKVSVNADRISKYEYEHGRMAVERFLDAVLAIDEHIDPNFQMQQAAAKRSAADDLDGDAEESKTKPTSPYQDLWKLDRDKREAEEMEARSRLPKRRRFPPEPVKDLLLFFAQHAPQLEDWQRDVILIVREEMQYFVPQMQTKILNEGFASFVHSRIMRELDISDADFAAFAQMHAGVLAPSRMHINPYHLGYKILEDIERRWDNPTEEERVKLGRQPGQGRAKLFEVREIESDLSLLRNYLTKELVEDLDLYLYEKEGDRWVIVEKNWEKVRDGIVASMTNFGYPYITLDDADFNRNTELLLRHHHEGQDLDLTYAEKTLEHVYYIWSRPVYLDTIFDGKHLRLSYNGERHVKSVLEGSDREKRAE